MTTAAQDQRAGGARLALTDSFRRRILQMAARRCADRGFRRIVLWGAGPLAVASAREPWRRFGLEVLALVRDPEDPPAPLAGAPVVEPDRIAGLRPDAVVMCVDLDEHRKIARAHEACRQAAVPLERTFGDPPSLPGLDASELTERYGLDPADARWLLDNRQERHDALLPMLPIDRTELHLRRYELAASMAAGKRALDAACGTGYGAACLRDWGRAASVLGVDADERAVRYATDRYGRDGVRFERADLESIPLPDGAADLAVSCETIEHVPEPERAIDELARVLAPAGRLVMTTPNDWGLTDHHEHSFDADALTRLVERRFRVDALLGQRVGNEPTSPDLPAGVFPLEPAAPDAETLIVVATLEPAPAER